MAAITVRNLRDETQQALREIAAANGRSMEAEIRAILDAEVERRQWLSDHEKQVLRPEQQEALKRLRAMFRASSERPDHRYVDEFLRERRKIWSGA